MNHYALDNLLFELNEKITEAKSIKRLHDIFKLRFVIDDANSWLSRFTAIKLE
ncbi:MAG: hypothetical protein HQL69_03590, partial [Magnetococcales bacterium]|nr:hypothetical protein [Magnetococcales bacterium]